MFLPLLIGVFTNIYTYGNQEKNNLEENKKKPVIVIRIGLCADYPPFEYQNRSGEIIGKNRKILEKLLALIKEEYSQQYEIKVQYRKIGFEEGFLLLTNNSLDILAASVSPNKKREENFSFIGPIFHSNMCLVKKKEEVKIIAVQVGSLQEEYAFQFYSNKKIVSVPLVFDMLSLYKHGRVDAIIINTDVYHYFKKITSLEGHIVLLDREEKIGFALRKQIIHANKFDTIIIPKLMEIFKKYQDKKKAQGNYISINQ
jgi:ABC-type amino acid transport substrate-binding protein